MREIELPADIAEPLRAQVRDGGLGGATVFANFRGASTRDFFLASKSELAEAIRAAYRDGHRLKV